MTISARIRVASRQAPWRVFLSHTSDLRHHPADRSFVAAAEAAVIRAGHAILDMAYFTARDEEPADYCIRMIEQADVYVGIIGHRYGAAVRSLPHTSYTELEFVTATRRGLPRLIFVVPDGTGRGPGVDQSADDEDRQARFRSRLQDAGLTTASIESTTDLEIALHQALVELQAESRLNGTPSLPMLVIPGDVGHTGLDAAPPLVDVWVRLDQPEIGDAISFLRTHAGLTRNDLIQRMSKVGGDRGLGVDASLMYRWERGERRRPRPRPGPEYRRILGLVCEREVEKMSAVSRREFLHRLSTIVGVPLLSASVGLDPGRIAFQGSPDAELLDGMAALTRNYLNLHNTVSPTAVRLAIARHFDDLTALALRSRSSSTAARVRSMAAQAAILAGWVSFNVQDVSQALMYWVVAHDLAREAGNASLQAHALGSRSRLYSPIHRDALEADPTRALALLDQGVQLAERAASPALRSWLLANRAQQFAATNRAVASQRDLESAARLASLCEQGEDDVLSGWSVLRVDAYRGICAMQLGQPAEVIAITESVLAGMSPNQVQRTLQQSDLAAAYVQQGDIEHACGLLSDALSTAQRTKYSEGVQRVRSVRINYLSPHAGGQVVHQLDEQLAETR